MKGVEITELCRHCGQILERDQRWVTTGTGRRMLVPNWVHLRSRMRNCLSSTIGIRVTSADPTRWSEVPE